MKNTQTIKKICLLISVFVLLNLFGCGTDSTQRVALYRQAADKLSAASEQLDKQLVVIEAVLQENRVLLADPNISGEVTEKIIVYIDQALAKKAEIEPVKAKVDTALDQIKTKLTEIEAGGEVDLSDELTAIGTMLTSTGTAAGGQYGPILVAIGMILPILAGAIASLKNAGNAKKQADESQKVTEKVIASVDSLLASPLVMEPEKAKELLKKDQGTAVAATVKTIKNS